MVTRSVVQSAMHTAVTALVHLPPEEWASWIVYLCETLEGMVETETCMDAAETVVQEIAERMQERLARGTWS